VVSVYHRWCLLAMLAVSGVVAAAGQQKEGEKTEPPKARPPVSFSKDVAPIISKNCMPCHAEDQFNPSELSLDSYELLMKGGKHGDSVKPGKSSESVLVQKLLENPPFGDRMPFDPRKKRKKEPMKPLMDEEIIIITEWVNQGAKGN
jgi:hypothetical protein